MYRSCVRSSPGGRDTGDPLLDSFENVEAIEQRVQPTRRDAVGAIMVGTMVEGVPLGGQDEPQLVEPSSKGRGRFGVRPAVKLIRGHECGGETETEEGEGDRDRVREWWKREESEYDGDADEGIISRDFEKVMAADTRGIHMMFTKGCDQHRAQYRRLWVEITISEPVNRTCEKICDQVSREQTGDDCEARRTEMIPGEQVGEEHDEGADPAAREGPNRETVDDGLGSARHRTPRALYLVHVGHGFCGSAVLNCTAHSSGPGGSGSLRSVPRKRPGGFRLDPPAPVPSSFSFYGSFVGDLNRGLATEVPMKRELFVPVEAGSAVSGISVAIFLMRFLIQI
jgi:hypothetical protein